MRTDGFFLCQAIVVVTNSQPVSAVKPVLVEKKIMSVLTLALLIVLAFGMGIALSVLLARPRRSNYLRPGTSTIVFVPAKRASGLRLAITSL